MVTRPEDIYPALSAAYNADDLETLVSLYDRKAVFVVQPGHVTESPAELHGAMQHLVALRGRLSSIRAPSFAQTIWCSSWGP